MCPVPVADPTPVDFIAIDHAWHEFFYEKYRLSPEQMVAQECDGTEGDEIRFFAGLNRALRRVLACNDKVRTGLVEGKLLAQTRDPTSGVCLEVHPLHWTDPTIPIRLYTTIFRVSPQSRLRHYNNRTLFLEKESFRTFSADAAAALPDGTGNLMSGAATPATLGVAIDPDQAALAHRTIHDEPLVARKNKGGRPLAYPWHEFYAEYRRVHAERGEPTSASGWAGWAGPEARVNYLADWCGQHWLRVPARETIRDHIERAKSTFA